MVRSIALMLLAALTSVVARVEGADSAIGKVFGSGAWLDWRFLLAAFAFPVWGLILVLVVRRRDRQPPAASASAWAVPSSTPSTGNC